jgi:predicted membrane protein
MAVTSNTVIFLLIFLLVGVAFVVCGILLIRYFIRYNAQQKAAKSKEQKEFEKMNLDDL